MGEGKCRVCGAGELSPPWWDKGVWLHRCLDCGFIQVGQMPTGDELAELYSRPYFERGKYGQDLAAKREQKRRLAWMLACGIAPGAKVLDAGCAVGEGIKAAKSRYEMWGIDISAHAIELARANNPELKDRLRAVIVEEADFPPGFFDAVVMWDVIEHLWDPLKALQGIARLLRPGGRLCLSTPNAGSAVARLMGRRWPLMTPPEHLGFFNPGSMERLLGNAGFAMTRWVSRGKWVNAGFLLYKLARVYPRLADLGFPKALTRSPLAKVILYAPTGDVAYVGARLRDTPA